MSRQFSPAGALWTPQDPNSRIAWIARNAPRIAWEDFITDVFMPKPGEHTLIVGSTGSGKTNLQTGIVDKWPFVAAFATKNNDVTMDRLIEQKGYERFARWYPLSARDHPRRVIWPPARNLKTMEIVQRKVFMDAMERIWAEGGRPKERPVGWAIAMDEVWWFANQLKMTQYIKIVLQQGRSNGISLLGASQRPAFIPTELYSQTVHQFFFAEQEKRNLDRLAEINYRDAAAVRAIVSGLEKYQVLYVNSEKNVLVRTRAPEF